MAVLRFSSLTDRVAGNHLIGAQGYVAMPGATAANNGILVSVLESSRNFACFQGMIIRSAYIYCSRSGNTCRTQPRVSVSFRYLSSIFALDLGSTVLASQ